MADFKPQKGDHRTVEENENLRVVALNLILTKTDMARGQRMAELASAVGLSDDRPKKLIQYIKMGGGTEQQLKQLIQLIVG
eukprot:m.307208 g.307208  ORF g.307208 m.307208 type:complete len:81 (+) comp19811_c0_seq1:96-338(+)